MACVCVCLSVLVPAAVCVSNLCVLSWDRLAVTHMPSHSSVIYHQFSIPRHAHMRGGIHTWQTSEQPVPVQTRTLIHLVTP